MNFLNPALVARAFLFFAYPTHMSGDKVWVAADLWGTDAIAGATPMGQLAAGMNPSASALDMLLGTIPGSTCETSVVQVARALASAGRPVTRWTLGAVAAEAAASTARGRATRTLELTYTARILQATDERSTEAVHATPTHATRNTTPARTSMRAERAARKAERDTRRGRAAAEHAPALPGPRNLISPPLRRWPRTLVDARPSAYAAQRTGMMASATAWTSSNATSWPCTMTPPWFSLSNRHVGMAPLQLPHVPRPSMTGD